MFAIPTPYFASREIYTKQAGGSMKASWQPCRVIGVTKDDDGEPAYIVEYTHDGITYLGTESYVRRSERGNPL
ncbi:hypothetical protein [Rhizobium multihospitium]|uniref:Uncharacterized protein n=1 Tax=Rhizobium multihospitium TaxID=410764 RepID=A0A1C3WP14_9HYPH|nr:hypothetical protein [Rhizobium multihospitium]SCB41710.1 hypothetical protein GA0061103_5906 [Rhizobium multihospitium]